MTAKRALRNVGIPALALSCLALTLSGENPAPTGGTDDRGGSGGGLSLEIRADPRPGNIGVSLVNAGGSDLLVRIGLMLGNGKKQFPRDLRIECRGAGDHRFVLSSSPAFVAGRVDPMVLPLPAGAAYTLSLDLRRMSVAEPRNTFSLPAGRYHVQAVLAGKPVLREETNSDMPGLSTMAFWTGTARSADLEVDVPAVGPEGTGKR